MEDMLSRKIGSFRAMVEDCHVDMFVVYAQKKNEEVTATPPGARSGNCLPDHGYRKAPSCCPSLRSRQSDDDVDFLIDDDLHSSLTGSASSSSNKPNKEKPRAHTRPKGEAKSQQRPVSGGTSVPRVHVVTHAAQAIQIQPLTL